MTTPITEWISKTEKLCESASEGPWEESLQIDPDPNGSDYYFSSGPRHKVLQYFRGLPIPDQKATNDAQFIADARTSMPIALKLIRKYRDMLYMISEGITELGFKDQIDQKLAKEALDYFPED